MQKAKDETRQREVAARLRALRLELNFEQFEIAELVGISPQRWHYYENAKRQFDFDVAATLCHKVNRLPGRKKRGLTMDYIYRGERNVTIPLDFYRRLQRLVREGDKAAKTPAGKVARAIVADHINKKSTRAKAEKADRK